MCINIKNKIAFFDFDGTISRADSFEKFIRFSFGDLKFAAGIIFLSPLLAAYKLKIIPNDKMKQLALSYFFKGMSEERFNKLSTEYSLDYLDIIVRQKAIERILWHQIKGHKVVVVSASIEQWLKPWCDKHNIDLISTKMEIVDGMVTGRLFSENCYGPEKVRRIHEKYNMDDYEYIYAYGDTRGDKEMLELSNEGSFKPFRKD